MSLIGFSTKIFGGFVDRFLERFKFLRKILQKADIKIPLRSYLSLSLFFSLLSFLFSFSFLFFLIKFQLFLKIIFSFLLSVLVASLTFVFFIFYPRYKMAMRAKDIEASLPFVIMHMGAVSESGVPPYVIFKLLSRFKEYGEISKEMGKIVRNIEKFGMDPLSAIRAVASRTPSDKFRQLLEGLVITTESGGNVTLYLKTIGEQTLFEWRSRRQRFIQQLSTYAEIYTGLIVAAPLFTISLFAVLGMLQPTIAGFTIPELMKISVYGLIPGINLLFLLFLKGVEVEI